MKLKYRKSHSTGFLVGGGTVENTHYHPISKISNFSDFKGFIDSLFVHPGNASNLEFVDIGEKSVVRAEFRRGPFNEHPIKFTLKSNHSKTFETHNVLNHIIGSLADNPHYFIRIVKGEIKIDKTIEVMG
jgi:hypothetical protein